jgi:hypothetical protein
MPTADTPADRLRENVVGVVSVLVTATWMGAMFTGQEWWLAALLVGYIAVVPITAMLFGDDEDVSEYWDDDVMTHSEDESRPEQHRESSNAGESTDQALQTLRERYASGELTEAQFERKLERLLEVETVEGLEQHVGREQSPEESTESAAKRDQSDLERERT